MATKRWKGGAWEYKVQRAGVLPRAVYLRFDDEAEGDVYVRRLEALLDRGVVPDELVDRKRPSTLLRDGVRAYLAAQHVSDSDREYLRIVRDRMPAGLELRAVTFAWATEWITRLKREDNLSPSTIRHHVGSLARALDWIAAKGDLPLNPLRLLPKGYATYTPEDGREATRNEGFVKADTERDRRLHAGEDEAIREIMHGAKPKGRQRPLEMRHGDRLELLYDMALAIGGATPAETLVVGDNLATDIGAAVKAGMDSVLLLTGVSSRADLVPGAPAPTYVAETYADVAAIVFPA